MSGRRATGASSYSRSLRSKNWRRLIALTSPADDDEKEELAYDDGLPVPAPENIMTDIDFPACINEFIDFESNMAGYDWAEVPPEHMKTVIERLREADYEVVENYHFPEPDDVSW
jgi:hypothetical protein